MNIPFAYQPTQQEIHDMKVNRRIKKAQHLAERFRNFLSDLEKEKLKQTDKGKILTELYKYIT